jgi:N-acetyl-gamma-glutamylphosphate reductase
MVSEYAVNKIHQHEKEIGMTHTQRARETFLPLTNDWVKSYESQVTLNSSHLIKSIETIIIKLIV